MCKKKVKLNVYYRDTKESEEMTPNQYIKRYGW